MPASNRPLSPHLSIYRFTWLMASSIAHRITGAALYLCMLLLLAWLIAMNQGPEAYRLFYDCAQSWVGKFLLLGGTFALMQHALGGIRHLIWDTGRGLSVPVARRLAIASFIGAAILTLLIWHCAGAFA